MSVAKSMLALIAVALAFAPAVSAIGVDAGAHDLSLGGQQVGVDTASAIPDTPTAPADADAGLALATGDSGVAIDGPSCTVNEKARIKDMDPACSIGGITTTLPNAQVSYYANLRLGSAEEDVSGEAATPSAGALTLQEQVVEAAPTTLLLVAATAGGIGLAYAVWRIAKLGLLGAFIPLATHIRDDELLEDSNRRAIYEIIKTEPGISTKEVAERLNLAWGTVTHHLGKLERRRFVVSKKYGKYRRYFVNGGTVAPENKDKVAVLKVARTNDVAEYIRTHPGMSQKEVGEALGVSSSTVLWHVKRLLDVNAISRVRAGKEVRYFPAGGETLIVPPAAAESGDAPAFSA